MSFCLVPAFGSSGTPGVSTIRTYSRRFTFVSLVLWVFLVRRIRLLVHLQHVYCKLPHAHWLLPISQVMMYSLPILNSSFILSAVAHIFPPAPPASGSGAVALPLFLALTSVFISARLVASWSTCRGWLCRGLQLSLPVFDVISGTCVYGLQVSYELCWVMDGEVDC